MDGSEQDRNHIENKGKGSSHAVPIPLLNNLIHLHWQSSVPCVSWVWFPQSAQVFLLFAVIALSQLPCRLPSMWITPWKWCWSKRPAARGQTGEGWQQEHQRQSPALPFTSFVSLVKALGLSDLVRGRFASSCHLESVVVLGLTGK